MLKIYLVVFIYLCASQGLASITTTSISGYTAPKNLIPSQDLSTDPLIAPLACPALTRLNLSKKSNELTLLTELRAESKTWRLKLKNNLKFWDGSIADEFALKSFVDVNFPTLLSDWQLSDSKLTYKTSINKDKSLNIVFSKKPNFGPYIFNRIPFFKTNKTNIGFSCVGKYHLSREGKDFLLKSSTHHVTLNSKGKSFDIAIKHADSNSSTPWIRYSHKKIPCSRKLDLPFITLINWNKDIKPTNNKDFRIALTTALPRGALVRSGAGYWGNLISGPILRHHPGYNKSVLVRSFDLNDAILKFENLGYLSDEAKKFDLILQTNEINSLAAKTTKDVLKRIGFNVIINPISESKYHGRISTVKVPWPEQNFIKSFHSKSSNRSNLVDFSPSLDAALEKYNVSLTKKSPNFSYLQNIHRELYKDEPYTLFMAHQFCLEGKNLSSRVSTLNPDWFKNEVERLDK